MIASVETDGPAFGHRGSLPLLMLLMLAACGQHDQAQPPEQLDLSASRLELFTPDSSGRTPVAAAVAADGRVWSLATRSPFLSVYSPGGELLRVMGDSGSGPGELRFPLGLVLSNDEAVLWDNARRTIVRLDTAGRSMGEVRPQVASAGILPKLPLISYGRPGQFRALGGGWALATYQRPQSQSVDENYLVVVRLDSSGAISDTLFNALADTGGVSAQLGRARELVPVPLWTACADSQVVSYHPLSGAVVRSDAHGKVMRTDTVSTAGGPLTEDAIRHNLAFQLDGLYSHGEQPTESERQAMLNSLVQQSKGTGRHPARAPVFVDVLCDHEGSAWLERFSLTDSPIGYGSSWLVIDRGGHRTEAKLPAGFRVLDFGPSGAIGFATDSMGVIRLARLRLAKLR